MSADATAIIGEIERGNTRAADRLLPLVYEKLHDRSPTLSVHERVAI